MLKDYLIRNTHLMEDMIKRIFRKFGFTITNRNTEIRNRELFLSKYDVKLNKSLLISSYQYIQKLENRLDIDSIEDYKSGVLIKFDNLQFYLESWEEFFILCEVFIDNDYNFLSNQDFILIDIGCNIGIASLFFSQKENIKKIYSFEPVKDTYENALINFQLNKNISSKIEVFNYGIGNSDKTEIFLFDKNIKGNTGIRGTKSINYKNLTSQEKREVIIKNATNVFLNIFSNNLKEKFVFKIDCEGAEYEILRNLDENNLISKIAIFMIEWHDEGVEILEKILIKNNFVVFSRVLELNSGMLYAYNTKF